SSLRVRFFGRIAIEQVCDAPLDGYSAHHNEQDHQYQRSQQTGFRTITAAAPKTPGLPYELIAYNLYCKSAQPGPEQRKSGVPAKMQPDRKPQVVRSEQRQSKQNSKARSIRHAERRRARIESVQEPEQRTDADDGRP